MAKKQRRSVSTAVETPRGEGAVQAAPRRFSGTATTEFNPDYSATKKGLKRIAILAVIFISILVILSFFLR